MITIGLAAAMTMSVRTSEPVSFRRTDIVRAAESIASDAEKLLAALNLTRRTRGLRPLVLDPLLCAIARMHGLDMATRRYFDHTSPEGETAFGRMSKAHYRFGYAGENLALDRDVVAASGALLRSTEHRQNMLEPHYAKVGIAAVASPDGEIFVEDFSD